MNWKRGLTRIYVVLWIIWGGIGVYLFTIYPVQELKLSVRGRSNEPCPTDASEHSALASEASGLAETLGQSVRPDLEVAVRNHEHRDITTAVPRAIGFWFLICALAPALVLWAFRWIASGFASQQRALA